MKVDIIPSLVGDFTIGYTKFNKGFYIDSYPEKLKEKIGLKINSGRDATFKTFDEINQYVKDIVTVFLTDYKFKRKVIIYYLDVDSSYSNTLTFHYVIANECSLSISRFGKEETGLDYTILETNINSRKVGDRGNLYNTVYTSADKHIIIDYNETTHKFIVDFVNNFELLKSNLKSFFDKDKFEQNIVEALKNKTKLLG